MATVANLDVRIGANTAGLKRGVSQAKSQIQNLRSSVLKLAGAFGAAFGVQQILKFVKASKAAFDIQIQAETRLLSALKGREDIQQRLIKQAQDLQKITLFGDEVTIQAQALLATLGLTENQIFGLIPLIQDMSIALGIDFKSAAALVGKTVGTTTDALTRYFDTGLAGVEGASARATKLTESLNKAFKGQAEAARVADLGTTNLGNSMGDLQETLVRVVASGGGVTSMFNNMAKAIDFINDETRITKFIENYQKINKIFKLTNPLFLISLGNIKRLIEVLTPAETGFEKVGDKTEEWGKQTETVNNELEKQIKTLATLRESLESVNELIEGIGVTDTGAIIAAQNRAAAIREEIAAIEGLALAQAKLDDSIPTEKLASLPAIFLDTTDAAKGVNVALIETGNIVGDLAGLGWQEVIELTQLLQEAFSNMMIGLGDSIARLVLSTGGLRGVLNNLLMVLVDFAKAFGAVLIAAGIAFAGSGIFAGTGIGLIAAGVGLQALGGIGGILLSNQSANIGSASSGVSVSGEFVLKGNTAAVLVERGNAFRGAVT